MATWRTVAASMTLASAVLAACSTAATSTASPSQTLKSSSPAGTVWLCRPGLAGDPCTGNLDLTIVPAHGARTVVRAPERQTSPFDCFYVYGTIGGQQT